MLSDEPNQLLEPYLIENSLCSSKKSGYSTGKRRINLQNNISIRLFDMFGETSMFMNLIINTHVVAN